MKVLSSVLILLGIYLHFPSVAFALTAKSYCLINSETKQIIRAKNHFQKLAPASTVKLLTAMVVLDRIRPTEKLPVSRKAARTEPSKIYLREGERVSCLDLLEALLMKSANDAAVVLEEACAATHSRFIKLMNQKARQIGCKNSRFLTPNGLPATGQYSCAYDLAVIAASSARYPVIRKILKKHKAIVNTSFGRKISVYTHNRFLKRSNPVYGKTGWTRRARHTFSGFLMAPSNQKIAIGVMASSTRANLWKDLRYLVHPQRLLPSTTSLQKILKRLGFYRGKVDGIYGPLTRAAVKQFQRSHHLKVDGIAGKNTWAKLREYQ